MRLHEQLELMRQLGIDESDSDLSARLLKVGYNMERAISDYFESPLLDSFPPRSISGSREVKPHKKRSIQREPLPPPTQTLYTPHATLPVPVRSSYSSYAWLLGRRVTMGYTLNAGYALRQTPLRLRREGVLAQHHTVPGAVQNMQSRKKLKFSAANLLFECEQQGSQLLHGRLPNLICNFLVPLLQNEMVVVMGHVAYDCGNIDKFRDLPLSLQVLATERFFEAMSRDVEAMGNDMAGECRDVDERATTILTSSEAHDREQGRAMSKAGNELLVWLTEGEDALLAARASDKKLADFLGSEDSSSGAAKGAEEPGEDFSESSAACEALGSGGSGPSMITAKQPALVQGLQMKKYQLQALQWMLDREIDPDPPLPLPSCSAAGSGGDVIVLEDSDSDTDSGSSGRYLSGAPVPLVSPPDVSLPIEGVLKAPTLRLTNSNPAGPSEGGSLWRPLVALKVPLPPSLDTDMDRVDVCFYSRQDISDIMRQQPSPQRKKKGRESVAALRTLWWNRYTQAVSCSPPPRVAPCRGGILADEMGLGKTIMCIALVASDFSGREDGRARAGAGAGAASHLFGKRGSGGDRAGKEGHKRGTLIVCPLSLMSQWLQEFRSRVKGGAMRVVMFYGSDRERVVGGRDGDGDGEEGGGIGSLTADVVITSYGVLTSEWRRTSSPPSSSGTKKNILTSTAALAGASAHGRGGGRHLLGREWRRVVLDEGHCIRSPATDTARACHLLQAERRWVLTGTPVQNKIDDLFSLMKFLKHQPWDKWRWWHTTITQPLARAQADPHRPISADIAQHDLSDSHNSTGTGTGTGTDTDTDSSNKGMAVVRNVLSVVMLRRTKQTLDCDTGKCIVSLPPRRVQYIFVDLSPAERSFYAALAKRSTAQMLGVMTRQQQQVARGGKKSALTGYAELFTLLMRLRQTCDHPVLVLRGLLEKQSLQSLIDGAPKQSSVDKDGEGGGDGGRYASDESCGDGLRETSKSKSFERIREKLSDGSVCNKLYLNDILTTLESLWQSSSGDHSNGESAVCSCGSGRGSEDTIMSPPGAALQQECCICLDSLVSPEDTALTPCGHLMCWACAVPTVKRHGMCPVCMTGMTLGELIPLGEGSIEQVTEQYLRQESTDTQEVTEPQAQLSVMGSFLKKAAGASGRVGSTGESPASNVLGKINWQMSSKLFALQEELERIFGSAATSSESRKDDNSISSRENGDSRNDIVSDDISHTQEHPKVVIFSQWTGMLDLVETMIQNVLVQPETGTQTTQAEIVTETETETATIGSNSHESSDNVVIIASSVSGDGGSGTVPAYFSSRGGRMKGGREAAVSYRHGLRPDCSVRFDGSLSQAQRSSALHRFNTDPQARILLISLKAGGVGLNLTAASCLFLLDPWWNPAVEDQAIDRVHRLGQQHPVRIIRLVCRDTVEEKLLVLQDSKRRMSREAMDPDSSDREGSDVGTGGGGSKLSLEELKGLFL